MKFVYVITSSESDYYLEQAIISIKSLLIHNQDAKIILMTDDNTIDNLKGQRKRILEFLSEVITVKTPELTPIQRSRYIKTSVRNHIKGDFWFIDTDTIITDTIPNIENDEIHVAAVLDKHLPIHEHTSRTSIIKYANLVNWEIPENNKYYNSGVMFVRDSVPAYKLYDSWHRIWLYYSHKFNLNIDQPALAKANAENNYLIKELPGIYNCQVNENGLKFLYNSKIIHYFASSVNSSWICPYRFRDKVLYKTVREKGVTTDIERMILNAKSEFISKCTIIGGIQSDIYTTPLMGIARRLSRKYPYINTFLYQIFSFIGKFK